MEALLNSVASWKSLSGVTTPVRKLSSSEVQHLTFSGKPISTSLFSSKQKPQSVHATLMEPTELVTNENSLWEFGKLCDNLTYAGGSTGYRFGTRSSSASSAPPHAGRSSGFSATSSGEVRTSQGTKHQKSRSLEEIERRRKEMAPLHKLRQGGFVEDSSMYRQIFVIRSYEVGADKATSIDTLFSLFQEMALCHVSLLGISGDGFGATRAMNRCRLIWVVTKMHVEVQRYPAWPEVVEIDSWVASAGKNGMRRDWVMRSHETGEVLACATSTWVMMNIDTRRISKFPVEVKAELEPCFIETRWAFPPSQVCPKIKLPDDHTVEFTSSNLTSCKGDLDVNQHVSNLKYIGWVLLSVPPRNFETHELTSLTLEYRRECTSSDVVESLTRPQATDTAPQTAEANIDGNASSGELLSMKGSDADEAFTSELGRSGMAVETHCQFTHLLRTQGENAEIVRGRTCWRPRSKQH